MNYLKRKSVRPETTSTVRNPSRSLKRKSFIKLNGLKNSLLENLHNYCNTTSIHGFNYITLPTNSVGERLFWLCVVIISIIATIILVIFSWLWTNKTPIVTVIESTHYPTWSIPFPAVSICSFNLISKRRAKKLASQMQRFENITDEKIMELFRITLNFEYFKNVFKSDYDTFTGLLKTNNFTIERLMNDLRPDCMEMLKRCKWKGNVIPCELLFQKFGFTTYMCCSFNYRIQSTRNETSSGVRRRVSNPYHITSCGFRTGLSVELTTQADDYWGTYYTSYGFRVLIHDPYDFSDENSEVKVFTINQETFLRINPTSTYATQAVRNLNIEKRKCYFSDEGNLNILKTYSFKNCMAECRNRLLYELCGCVLPLLNIDQSLSCSYEQYSCILTNLDIFSRANPESTENFSYSKITTSFPCNCIDSCETNNYDTVMTMGNLKKTTLQVGNDSQKLDNDRSILHVFYGSLKATRYRADVFEDWVTTLATFGGLMGLIIGFSIVSAFEFIYFLTLRPIFNYFFEKAL